MPFVTDLQRFRFYADDGSESGATALAAQNSNVAVDVLATNINLVLRAGLQETGNSGPGNGAYKVEFSRNSGAYSQLTTATSFVRGYDSSNLTDDGATTQRLTGGTGSFEAGKVTEDGLSSAGSVLNNLNRTEVLATLQIVAADVADGDTLDFRVYHGSAAAPTYAATPRITIIKDPPSRRAFSMFFDHVW